MKATININGTSLLREIPETSNEVGEMLTCISMQLTSLRNFWNYSSGKGTFYMSMDTFNHITDIEDADETFDTLFNTAMCNGASLQDAISTAALSGGMYGKSHSFMLNWAKNKITAIMESATPATPAQTPATPAQTPATPAQTPATPATPAQTPATPATPAQTPATPATPAQTPATPATPAQTPATPAQTPATPATPELAAAFKHAFVQTASFVSLLGSLQLKKDSKLQAFVNEYRIDAVTAIKQLSKKSNDLNNAAAAKKLRILSKALIAAVKSDDINVLVPIINYVNATNDDNDTVIITIFEILKDSGYLPESEPEEDPKDPDPKDPSDSGAVISEPVETPMVANNITIEERFRALKSYMDDLWTTDPHSPEVVSKAKCIMSKMCSIATDIKNKPTLEVNATEHYIWKFICKLSDIVKDIDNSRDSSNFHRILPASYISFIKAKNKDQAIDNMAMIRCNTTVSDPTSAPNKVELPTDILNRMLEQPTPSKKGTSKHPNVPEATEKDGKIPTDTDLAGIFELYVTMAGPINGYCGHLHRHHLNMILNYIMNDMGGVATEMAKLGAKKPIKLREVSVDKYTTDRNRFDVVFEAETNTENEPVVLFYHMEPTFDIKENKWSNDLLVKPYKECVLAADALARRQAQEEAKQKAEAEKKAKKNGKSNKQSKSKKKEEQVAPQPQAMTATA